MERTASLQRTLKVVGCLVTALLLNTRTVLADDEAIGGPEADQLATLNYWTPERMKDAEHGGMPDSGRPTTSPPITPGGDKSGHARVPEPYAGHFINRVTGELFYYDQVHNTNRHCTASVITSKSKRLLLAAAHCFIVIDQPTLVWNQYPMFVPAYDGSRSETDPQRAPYGFWPVRQAYVSATLEDNPFNANRDDSDLAVAGVFDQSGKRIEDAVGGVADLFRM